MKRSLAMTVGAVALLATGLPLAQDAKAPASRPGVTTTQSDPSMGMSSQMGQMDDHMKKMQALHDRMMSATTPEERQKVMEQQRTEMQAGMSAMNHMQGGAMMGGGMRDQTATPADANAQMQMMQKRMDMMQMMMQTMLDQQGMMAGPKSLDAAPKQ